MNFKESMSGICLLLLISGCATWENLLFLEHRMLHESHYKNYINSSSEHKVLYHTNVPVQISIFNEVQHVHQKMVKYYSSTNQNSYDLAIIEAYEYCKRDNEEKAKGVCELKMVGNFDASKLEQAYAFELVNSNYFQITIRNLKTNDCGYNNNTLEWEWWKCKTAIRINPDSIMQKPETPIRNKRSI